MNKTLYIVAMVRYHICNSDQHEEWVSQAENDSVHL